MSQYSGELRFHVGMRFLLAEVSTIMQPDQIKALMEGIAKVVAAGKPKEAQYDD